MGAGCTFNVTFADRLRRAVDAHDVEALADCFSPDYRNETPAHPGRGFLGREQVREKWARIFAAVPDVTAQWRANFDGGVDVKLHHRGRSRHVHGILVEDSSAVAERLRHQFANGTKPRDVGLRMRPEHVITPTDVAAVKRAMIRLETIRSRSTADPCAMPPVAATEQDEGRSPL